MSEILAVSQLLHESFEQQALQKPNATAICFDDEKISYQGLYEMVANLSKQLVINGAKKNKLIAVVMEKGWEQIVAVLSILKAGAAYLPLNPEESIERLSELIKHSEIDLILTQQQYAAFLKKIGVDLLVVEKGLLPITDLVFFPEIISTDLAYVIFTSGSTGLPKGVMIDHQNALNTIEDINSRFFVNHDDRVFALSSLTFDLSVYDIFGSLTQGATIVLPNAQELKEPAHWFACLTKQQITIWNSAPALMQMLIDYIEGRPALLENKAQFAFLRLVLLSGDWIPLNLPDRIRRIFKNARVISLGGATEGSIWSILYPIDVIDPKWKSIPYGRPLKNQTFYILDQNLNAVKNEKSGELYIGGKGVAKGYWKSPDRTHERFIIHPQYGRLYKTGDLGRYLPDGNIEFLGRVDQQIKIRGNLVELSAIESCLLEYPSIEQAVVTFNNPQSSDAYLTAYLVCHFYKLEKKEREKLEIALSQEQLENWLTIYNNIEQQDDADISAESFSKIENLENPFNIKNTTPFNLSGWISSYTEKKFSRLEMKEWVENTVDRILSLSPKRLLEIGCGTGLLLFRISPHTEYYCGTDFSSSVLEYVEKKLDELSLKNIVLKKRAAVVFPPEEIKEYDTVVLNSVVQYFPSIDYLVEVLEGAIACTSKGGSLFIGDIRNLHTLEAFHTSVEFHKANPELTLQELKGRIQRSIFEENELLISPEFFETFAKLHPRITHVDIRGKRGKLYNEMNNFRYDVIFSIESDEPDFFEAPSVSWERLEGFPEIHQTLMQKKPLKYHITGVPNARMEYIERLSDYFTQSPDNTMIERIQRKLLKISKKGIDPEIFYQLGDDCSYQTQISWSKENPYAYNVLFYQTRLPNCSVNHKSTTNPFPQWEIFANMPLKGKYAKNMASEIRHFLNRKLPQYMCPSYYVFLDQLPTTSNGKIDRQALPPVENSKKSSSSFSPKSELQQKLESIWAKSLGCPAIDIHDQFTHLGGNSLLAVQVAADIHREMAIEINSQDLLCAISTIYTLSNFIQEKLQKISGGIHLENKI